MINYLITALLLLIPAGALAGERDAIHWIGNGTGFVVANNYLVTAKHCTRAEKRKFKINDVEVDATRAYDPPGADGPIVYKLDGGPYESLPLATAAPKKGDLIYTAGYGCSYWGVNYGRVREPRGKTKTWENNYIITDHRINPGQSGGPILNEDGEVLGVSIWVSTELQENYSGFTTYEETGVAIVTAITQAEPIEIVVFTYDGCTPCIRLKQDVIAGKFPGYKFVFVNYSQGKWSDPDLYREFYNACKPETLSYPTIWVKGTAKYTEGYGESRGLLGWLVDAVRGLLRGIIGKKPELNLPPPVVPPSDEPVQSLKDAVKDAVVDAIVNPSPSPDEEPVSPWWGLLGLLSGLAHRRFA